MTGQERPPREGEPPGPGVASTTRITTAGGGRWRPAVLVVAGLAALTALVGGIVTGRMPDLTPGEEAAAPDPARPGHDDGAAGRRELVRSDPVARRAFAGAVDRLEQAGSFAYEGTTTGFSPVGGATSEVAVEGEVALPRTARQRSRGQGGGITEEVVVGPNWWSRSARSAEALATAPWELIYQGPDGLGMTQLPQLLASVSGHRDLGTDARGRRRARATIPDGEIQGLLSAEAEGDGEVVLTVDGDGTPLVVELTTATPESGDVTSTWRLSRLGDPVEIALPPGTSIRLDGMVTDEDLVAAGIEHPVGLHGLPRGWIPVLAEIDRVTRPGCPTLRLGYAPIDRPLDQLGVSMAVNAPECEVPKTLGWEGEPVTIAGLEGEIGRGGAGTFARLRSARVAVQLSVDLPGAQAERVLATLGPLDLSRQPEPIDGLAGPPG